MYIAFFAWMFDHKMQNHTYIRLHRSKDEVEQHRLTLAHKLHRALNSRFVDLLTGFSVQ
jgi:hypothetical protein